MRFMLVARYGIVRVRVRVGVRFGKGIRGFELEGDARCVSRVFSFRNILMGKV